MSNAEWIKWWKSKTAWKLIGIGATAMIGSLCAALFLPYPYNLISVIAVCTPCGLSMRKIIINALIRVISKKNEETEA